MKQKKFEDILTLTIDAKDEFEENNEYLSCRKLSKYLTDSGTPIGHELARKILKLFTIDNIEELYDTIINEFKIDEEYIRDYLVDFFDFKFEEIDKIIFDDDKLDTTVNTSIEDLDIPDEIFEEKEPSDLDKLLDGHPNCGELKNYYTDIIKENVKLQKANQRKDDSNRIERRGFRNFARIESNVEQYNKDLIKLLNKHSLTLNFKDIEYKEENNNVGLIHITDTHFSELVNLQDNKYDFTIASKRLQKFIHKAKLYYENKGINKIVLALTGDLINSDRRPDESLNNSTNRSKATFLALQLLEYVIVDLSKTFNKIMVVSVTGNESRIPKDIGWTDLVATDNYDFTIFHMLRYIFKNNKDNIYFDIPKNPLEHYIAIDVSTKEKEKYLGLLFLHGNQALLTKNVEKGVQTLMGKYNKKGLKVDFVLFGHLHSSYISDIFARGGSTVGANSYSDSSLHLISKASQNLHILKHDGIDSIKVDLQDYSNYSGYDINKELLIYEARGVDNNIDDSYTVF